MNALDVYRDVLKELDAWGSPAFNIRQFNYFFNRSISEYVAENYSRFDILGKEDDDIGSIVKIESPLTVDPTTRIVDLPQDYRHLLNVRVSVKFVTAVGKNKVNDIRIDKASRIISSEKGFMSGNSYGQPTWNNIKYELTQSKIKFSIGSYVVFPSAVNMWLDYVMIPPKMFLNPDTASDYNNVVNNTLLFYNSAINPNHIYFEINKLCAKIFAENQRNERLNSMIGLDQMTPK